MITLKEAEKLPTKRLLTYYKKYGHNWTGKWFCEICGDFLCIMNFSAEKFNQYDIEASYWQSIKELLNKREHVKI